MTLRLGLIAPELPPDLGGMAELARGLALALGETEELILYTLPEHGIAGASFEQRPVLSGQFATDAKRLAAVAVDAWLALNAGLVPLARRLPSPFYAYFHGNDFLNPWLACGGWFERFRRPYCAPLRRRLRRGGIRHHLPAVQRIFTNSHGTAGVIRRQFRIAEQRVEVVHPGVDDRFFQQARPSNGESLRLLTVSRLSRYVRRKNIDGVLRALQRLDGKIPVHYTVAGDGDDLPRLRALADELGLTDRVTFTGRLGQDELLTLYADCDLFILASLASEDDIEGFGIVYIEASAAGVPVLCSREGGAVDAVEHGVNGLVLSSSSPRAIAEGIEQIHHRRDDFRPERIREVAERYRWPKIAAQLSASIRAREPGQ
ncbi:MAG: glycosyltransferase [Acidobacteriota bacterium]